MEANIIVNTSCGRIEGYEENGMIAFKGIPFAKAPVGELRFKPPVAVEPWEGIYKADHFGKRSLQTGEQEYSDDLGFSEDCLDLNIWIPREKSKSGQQAADEGALKEGGLPVIFYIHGGGHCSGANSDRFFDGPHLIRNRKAIMVAPAYRLGALGYLYLRDYLGEEYADSGNLGLLDQLLALKWVHENIAAFGGDPDMVILMGQSAGAKSVANLMVTPAAKGLFKRAILQSGACQCIRDTQTASKLTRIILEELGLTRATASRILTIDGEEIIKAQEKAYKRINFGHIFGPVLDGRTISESPEDYIREGKLGSIEVLIGYNRKELYFSDPARGKSREEAAEAFKMCYGLYAKHAMDAYEEYLKTEDPVEAFDHVQSEFIYGNGTLRLTQLLADNGVRTWSYLWNFEGNTIPYHFTEMPYIFGYSEKDAPGRGYAMEDMNYSLLMNETWMSFILTGDPENVLLPKWPPCETGEMGYRMYFEEKPHLEQFRLHSYWSGMPMQVIKL
ncbi:carboxylesterase/lipase family protein [Butyrivibrio sp. MC2013]|uniref:carboxylesterase/lipase family protein n=1 Tax=Butyrivibrio sp. MC2013 TaxID=1280686 RepID=UPI0018C9B410|nr:carboxylesterase family protein [Butyrivibrio sp. MC2013]